MLRRFYLFSALILLLYGCAEEGIGPGLLAPEVNETFESASKRSYDKALSEFGSGPWLLDDALIGTTDEDRKRGSRAVRIRNAGSLRMAFDVDGALTITIWHATYGSDEDSEWELYMSTDYGRDWDKVGNTLSSSPTLQKVSFNINESGPVRFEIRKTDGAGRLNIDDIEAGEASGNGIGERGTPLIWGNPSLAVTDENEFRNYLMIKPAYSLSYHRDRGTANWVAWHLSPAWKGDEERQDDFRPDPDLPSGWYPVGSDSYTNTGFDRGHLCPSEDRDSTLNENSATFLMTNIIPQAPDLNRGPWKDLETYCRTLMDQGNELYIFAGGDGSGGSGSNGGTTSKIDNGRVTVPKTCWKIILILPEDGNDLDRVSTATRVIAVEMPNKQSAAD
ncbi:MAG: DNA/RNA non-specific endonuclease, partial [Bacteroidetes bacterium]